MPMHKEQCSVDYYSVLKLHSIKKKIFFNSGHIQANLEDELVQEALRKGLDLRQYSREIETELRKVELRSIEDCILNTMKKSHISRSLSLSIYISLPLPSSSFTFVA